jgi:NifB/MoaA-like Fe-S oxidoreductase
VEFDTYYEELPGDERYREISLATGVLAAPFLKKLVLKLKCKYPNIKIEQYTILNHYFGTDITVAGLITGGDIISQLKGQPLGESLLLPDVLLRNGETVLLDDVTVDDMENALQTKIRIVQSDGKSFIDSIIM